MYEINSGLRNFSGGPMVRVLQMQGVQVQSLVSKLGSHMLCGVTKKSDLKIYKEKN